MHDLIDAVTNGGGTTDDPGRTPRLRPDPNDLETGNGWPMGVFARYRTRGGAVIDFSRGLTTAIEVSCGGCPYRTVIDPLIDSIDGATYENAGEKFEELAWTAAKTHADLCGTADFAPPEETLADRLEFATDQVEVNTDEIINHHLTMANLPGLTTYLRAVIDQSYQIAMIAKKPSTTRWTTSNSGRAIGTRPGSARSSMTTSAPPSSSLRRSHRARAAPRPPRRSILPQTGDSAS